MGVDLAVVDLGAGFLVAEMALGRSHSCALSLAHLVKCFGQASDGQLGYGDTIRRGDNSDEMGDNLEAVSFPETFVPRTLSAGSDVTCVTSTAFEVMCWGNDHNGGEIVSSLVPEKIEFSDGFEVAFVELGYSHGCAVSLLGRVEVHFRSIFLNEYRLCVSVFACARMAVLWQEQQRADERGGAGRYGRRGADTRQDRDVRIGGDWLRPLLRQCGDLGTDRVQRRLPCHGAVVGERMD